MMVGIRKSTYPKAKSSALIAMTQQRVQKQIVQISIAVIREPERP
jgi:hypothetical protein